MGRRNHRPAGHAEGARPRTRRRTERADSGNHLRRLSYVAVGLAALAAGCGGGSSSQPGRWLVYVRYHAGEPSVVIARTDGTGAHVLVQHAYGGTVSPDGRWVSYHGCIPGKAECLPGNGPVGLFVMP